MQSTDRSGADVRADIASIRDDVAAIAGRPRRMLKLAAILAGVVVVGFLLLAAIGAFIGPPDYRKIHDEAYSDCVGRGNGADFCSEFAARQEFEARLRDDPELRAAIHR